MSRLNIFNRRDRTPVVELQRSNPVRFGLVVLLLIVVVVYFGFTKHIPFKHGFRLKAQFASSLDIASKSPVRIAGVNVGKVASVQREGESAVVTMEIEKQGLPIHSDATVKIRPRIFLEGNYFVDLSPGSPTAPTVSSGYTIPLPQTSDPVQIDQLLTALNSDTRANLQTFLAEYGSALTQKPTAAQNAAQDPEVRGLNAAQAFSQSFLHAPAALRGSAIALQAIGGTERNDLSGLVRATEHLTGELNVHEQQLGELVGNLNAFLGIFAAQSSAVTASVHELPGTLTTAQRAFAALDRFLPPLRAFSLAIIPGVEQTAATTQAALPWIVQSRGLLGPKELGGVAQGLQQGAPTLAGLLGTLQPFFGQLELLNKCLIKVFYPAGEVKLQDGANTSGVPNQGEFFSGLVGFTSSAQAFDGNGPFQRLLVTGGQQTIVVPSSTLPLSSAKGFPLAATTAIAPLGTSPRVPTTEPPYKPLVPCYTQAVPNLNGPLSQGPADGSAG